MNNAQKKQREEGEKEGPDGQRRPGEEFQGTTTSGKEAEGCCAPQSKARFGVRAERERERETSCEGEERPPGEGGPSQERTREDASENGSVRYAAAETERERKKRKSGEEKRREAKELPRQQSAKRRNEGGRRRGHDRGFRSFASALPHNDPSVSCSDSSPEGGKMTRGRFVGNATTKRPVAPSIWAVSLLRACRGVCEREEREAKEDAVKAPRAMCKANVLKRRGRGTGGCVRPGGDGRWRRGAREARRGEAGRHRGGKAKGNKHPSHHP